MGNKVKYNLKKDVYKRQVLEKATGEYHKEAEWLVDVLKAEN